MSSKTRRKKLAIRSCPYCEAKISIRRRECEFCGNLLRKKRYAVFSDPNSNRKKQATLTKRNSPRKVSPTATTATQQTSIDDTMSSQSLGVVSPSSSSSDDSSPPHAPPPTSPPDSHGPHSNEPLQQNSIQSPPTSTTTTQDTSQPTHTTSPSTTGDVMMTSPLMSQPATLPDFMTALNMTPTISMTGATNGGNISGVKTDQEGRNGRVGGGSDNGTVGEEVERHKNDNNESEMMEVDNERSNRVSVEESLTDKFKRDPNEVLQLLQSALSMDKLSSLISETYQKDQEQLQQLQTRLEAAYHILKDCTERKESLTSKIDETGDKIKSKRKHLETLREELQALGEEELHIKRRRDSAFERCTEIKQTLRSSRDALHQLSILSPSTAGGGAANKTEHAQNPSVAAPQGANRGGGSGNVADKNSPS